MTVLVGRGVIGRVDSASVSVPGSQATRVLYLTPPAGRTLRYAFQVDSGFKGLAVRGGPTTGRGGGPLPDSGTLSGGSGPRYLSATADLVVHVQPENRGLYELVKSMYLARDPLPVYGQVVCERERLARVYGDTLAARLADDVDYVLQGELPQYWEHAWRVDSIVEQKPAHPMCVGSVSPPRPSAPAQRATEPQTRVRPN